ncbi:MAG: TIGR02757 family protein [Muribaculaceae bacterium]|nr:TIGR02757 family protein [Muribaculaceae bacterium]
MADLLLREAARINRPEFIGEDPVQFPRLFDAIQDIEITALTVAAISWGRRAMILRDARRMLDIMEHQPFRFMMEKGYESLDPALNIHRTFFGRDLQWYLRGLREIYLRHDSLDAFAASIGAGQDSAPAWMLAESMLRISADANGGTSCPRCLPTNMRTTALKRVNMALRWLVRDDGIVDIGVWKSIPKSRLFIPLDVHAGNTARALGLLSRKANDRKSVELLTAGMREICPEDPALMDFALFGVGVHGELDRILDTPGNAGIPAIH